jgi:hypothetical protein
MRWRRFRSLFGLRPEADVEHELAFHIEMRTRELVNRGESPDRARELALQRFGDYESERRECVAINRRRRRKLRWADSITELRQDLRYGLRMLGRAPGFTAAALVTLAIGIGANAAVFSVVNSVLLKPLPYPDADQLVAVSHSAPGAPGRSGDLSLSPSMFFTYADENRTFQHVGIWISGSTTVTGLAEPEELRSILVTHGVLQALNVQPVLGRWLDQSDQIPQGPATLMVTYGYWQRRFGGDPSIIGRTISVGSRPRKIVGVMPDGFRVLDTEVDVIVPFAFDRSRLLLAGFSYHAIARLNPGTTIADANADIARMLPIWMRSWRSDPAADPAVLASWRITPAIRPLRQELVGDIGHVLWIVMATVGVVMLIARQPRTGPVAQRPGGGASGVGRRAACECGADDSIVSSVVGRRAGICGAAVSPDNPDFHSRIRGAAAGASRADAARHRRHALCDPRSDVGRVLELDAFGGSRPAVGGARSRSGHRRRP